MERPSELRTADGTRILAYRNLFDDVRLVVGAVNGTVTLTAQEARQLAAMLRAAAPEPDA